MIVTPTLIVIGIQSFQYTRKVTRVISLGAKNFLSISIHIMMLRSAQTCVQLTLIAPCSNSEEFNTLIQDGAFYFQSVRQVHLQMIGMSTKLFRDNHQMITTFVHISWLI
jgi:uncharacterized membrane protein